MFNYELSFYSNQVGCDPMQWDIAMHPISATNDDEAVKFAEEFIKGPTGGKKRGPIILKKVVKFFQN